MSNILSGYLKIARFIDRHQHFNHTDNKANLNHNMLRMENYLIVQWYKNCN